MPGNLPGRVGSLEDTFCPNCNTPLIQRYGYSIRNYRITPAGACPQMRCGDRRGVEVGTWSLSAGTGWNGIVPFAALLSGYFAARGWGCL